MASLAKMLSRQCSGVRLISPKVATKIGNPSLKYSSSHLATLQASPDSLVLSDSCVTRLNAITEHGGHLRIFVEGGGCSGFQYKFDLEEGVELEEDDVLIEREGAKVVVDETSLEYLKGSTLDYHTELIRAAFRIVENPKAEQGCSCGASFSVKLDL